MLPVLASAVPLVAQREPPTALSVEDPRLPDFELRSLISGAELIVVSDHEQPFVTVNLVFRGGTSADPERQAGVAALTAELLTAGVQGQLAGQVAEDLDALGALLGTKKLRWNRVTACTSIRASVSAVWILP